MATYQEANEVRNKIVDTIDWADPACNFVGDGLRPVGDDWVVVFGQLEARESDLPLTMDGVQVIVEWWGEAKLQ